MHLVKFGAPWCVSCANAMPKIEEMLANYPALEFVDVDIEENPDYNGHLQDMGLKGNDLRIMTMPTFAIYRNGEFVFKCTKLQEVEDYLEKTL